MVAADDPVGLPLWRDGASALVTKCADREVPLKGWVVLTECGGNGPCALGDEWCEVETRTCEGEAAAAGWGEGPG